MDDGQVSKHWRHEEQQTHASTPVLLHIFAKFNALDLEHESWPTS
ncbi:hypothetical protein Ptr86124_003392 [Pyrenophora tritici-repentis]|uniref:Uncharacterized protein n=1 Tax=Pyrenophora tritici-repentis TaxID=45151 RepID=A0A922NLH7_9PLEO|nr:hypothetical protein Ptr86124_003392 [Pyrenophora tritici-repentis]